MDTVESLTLKVEYLESVVNSLSARIDITSVGVGALHGLLEKIKEDVLQALREED
jgi:hypothetical protein